MCIVNLDCDRFLVIVMAKMTNFVLFCTDNSLKYLCVPYKIFIPKTWLWSVAICNC